MRRKPSRGLVALVPGATLDVDVPGLGLHVGQDASVGSGWRMQLQYLVSYEGMGTLYLNPNPYPNRNPNPEANPNQVSYEGMGRVALQCLRGCACEPQQLDAHPNPNPSPNPNPNPNPSPNPNPKPNPNPNQVSRSS